MVLFGVLMMVFAHLFKAAEALSLLTLAFPA